MLIEAFSNLRCNVGEIERFLHGLLRKLGVSRRDHVSFVVPALAVVLRTRAERHRNVFVLKKVTTGPFPQFRGIWTLNLQPTERSQRQMLSCLLVLISNEYEVRSESPSTQAG